MDTTNTLMAGLTAILIPEKTETAKPYPGNKSIPLLAILALFLEYPEKEFSGYEVHKKTKLQTGTVYPTLARLREAFWLVAEWEEENPVKGNKPRLLYTMTEGGQKKSLEMLEETISPNISRYFKEFNEPVPTA